jgi:serine/threonine protein kinase
MSLVPGTHLGRYEIGEPIGKGGQGEVYDATDVTLGRRVAIKVLPEALARDSERMSRFEREAKLLAALNHPNIATIHGFEEAGDTRFLVMELVDGETLSERIARGPLPIEEALAISRQIALGLEAAHEKSIVHRDLKPANVQLTSGRDVKILDFGLAKAFDEKASEPAPFLATSAEEVLPRFSPDGMFVAYQSNTSGNWEIYVRPFPSGEARWQISVGGGVHPRWSSDGEEIFYLANNVVMAVPVETEPTFRHGERLALLQRHGTSATSIAVVVNWFTELERLVPTN